jgi:TonB family protein
MPAVPPPVSAHQLVQAEQTPDVALETVQGPESLWQTVVTSESQGALGEVLPGYLRNPPPIYPKLARERGYQGTVLLEVQVLPSGRCGQIAVQQSSGFSILDDAAVEAVKRWQFKPATQGCTPVTVWVEIPIRFQLTR